MRNRRARSFSSGAALSLLLLSSLSGYPAGADDSPTLTGDWGGLRTQLLDRGINLTTIYTSELANNPRGGGGERTAYADEFAFGATFDFQRLFDWNGAHFQITVTDRNGHDLDLTANLHTLMQVQEIYGRGQTWRLTEFWFQQTWFDDRLLLKVGRLAVGQNFGSFSCNFQNLTFCGSQPGSVRGDYWYNYPVSQWGTRLEYAFNENVKLKLGVFQVNPTYIDDSWAAHNGLLPDNPSGTTGALIPLEVEWTPKYLSLPDSLKFGVWYDTSSANDVYLDVNHQPLVLTGGAPLQRHGRDGAYLSFEQQISGVASKSGAQLFLNITQADRETSPSTDRQIAFGVQYKGPFETRPNDVAGLGVGTTHVNSRVAASERLRDEISGSDVVPVQSSEYEAEVYYGWTPWPFATLRPNLQYVVHPGGSRAYANDVVIGLKTTIKF
jgi:porin